MLKQGRRHKLFVIFFAVQVFTFRDCRRIAILFLYYFYQKRKKRQVSFHQDL